MASGVDAPGCRRAGQTAPGTATRSPRSHGRGRLVYALPLLTLATLWLAPTTSLSATPLSAATLDLDTQSRIESLRSAIGSSALDETQQQAALAQLDAAAGSLADAARLRDELARLQSEAAAESARRKSGPEAPDVDGQRSLDEWAARLPRDADVELLEGMLQQQRGFIAERTDGIQRIEAELAMILARPSEIAAEIAALVRRADDLSAPVGTAAEEPDLLRDARKVRRASELRLVETEL
jgi:hypothetical protein